MATPNRLSKLVKKLIDGRRVSPECSARDMRDLYEQVKQTTRVPDYVYTQDGGRWQAWNEARLWGDGPNESVKSFEQEVMSQFWGVNDYVPWESHWPDAYSAEERMQAAEWGVMPHSIPAVLWLLNQPEYDAMWDHFCVLKRDRSGNSPYAFSDVTEYVNILKEVGWERMQRYTRAATWRLILATKGNLDLASYRDALTLHTKDISGEQWATVIGAFGAKRVATLFREFPETVWTPVAVRSYFRSKAEWIPEIAYYMQESWEKFGSDSLKKIDAENWKFVDNTQCKARLMAGEKPVDIADGVLTKQEAHQWVQSGCISEPLLFLAKILGLEAGIAYRFRKGNNKERSIMLRWYAAKKDSRGMLEFREWRDVNAVLNRVNVAAIIDEIHPEDLVNGIKTDPERVFRSVMTRRDNLTRLMEEQKAKYEEENRKLRQKPFPQFNEKKPVRGVDQVRSWDRLIEIGNKENHCAGSYVHHCSNGETFMFQVTIGEEFSLFQVTQGTLVQHYARGNGTPPASHRAAVNEWIRHNGG